MGHPETYFVYQRCQPCLLMVGHLPGHKSGLLIPGELHFSNSMTQSQAKAHFEKAFWGTSGFWINHQKMNRKNHISMVQKFRSGKTKIQKKILNNYDKFIPAGTLITGTKYTICTMCIRRTVDDQQITLLISVGLQISFMAAAAAAGLILLSLCCWSVLNLSALRLLPTFAAAASACPVLIPAADDQCWAETTKDQNCRWSIYWSDQLTSLPSVPESSQPFGPIWQDNRSQVPSAATRV